MEPVGASASGKGMWCCASRLTGEGEVRRHPIQGRLADRRSRYRPEGSA